MSTTIRTATPDDAALLHELAVVTFPLAAPDDTAPEAIADFLATTLSAASFAKYLSDPQRALFVSETDGVDSGYTMVVFGEPGDSDVAASVTVRPTAELSKCYVRPEFHGGGVASALIEASVDAARQRGARSLWLGVNQYNARANRFYEKSGFAIVGTKRFLLGGRYEDDFTRELAL